jgi:hypothetical protein
MQVLRVCSFSTFSLPPAFPPCYCPLAFRRQVRRLTSRMSSESYPGYPECVVSCHGAGRLANSIRRLNRHMPRSPLLHRNLFQESMSSWPLSAGCATHGILWPSRSNEAPPEHGFARYPAYTHILDTTSSQQYLLSGTHGIDLCARTCHNPLGEPFEVHGCAGALADRFELCSRYHAFVHHRRLGRKHGVWT